MGPEHEITEGIRMGAIAVVSAVVTATLVIGAGRALAPQAHEAQARDARVHAAEAPVVRAALP